MKLKHHSGLLDLSIITEKYFTNINPVDINNGECFNWALSSYLEDDLKNNFVINLCILADNCKHGNHAFLKINDLFYDAQVPKGVISWRYLPFTRIYEEKYKIPIHQKEVIFQSSLKEFISFWMQYPTGKQKLCKFTKKYFPNINLA